MPPASADEPLRFGHFELHPAERVLRVSGEPVALGSRAFDLLLALAQRHERLVTKQELLDLVWPGLVVEEHNIATQISYAAQAARCERHHDAAGLRLPVDGRAASGAPAQPRSPRPPSGRATTCRTSARASSAARRRSRISRACCRRRGC